MSLPNPPSIVLFAVSPRIESAALEPIIFSNPVKISLPAPPEAVPDGKLTVTADVAEL